MKSYEIEGCNVFALMIKINDQQPEVWEIYSNLVACRERGKEIVKGFKSAGINAEYCCHAYIVRT